MNFNIQVNNREIVAQKGDTILQALRKNGMNVPTLCNMKGFSPTGACRMCVVELEGHEDLVPACSYPVEEWMKIKTHSLKVIEARKSIIEMLLANHPDDCLYCIRNEECELQHFSKEIQVFERKLKAKKKKLNIDNSSNSIVRDPSKCILCSRCVRVCEEVVAANVLEFSKKGKDTIISTAFNKPLNLSSCIFCGQCVLSCPTGALHERSNVETCLHALNNESKVCLVQYDPVSVMTIAEHAGLKQGKDHSGIMNAALRKMGFYGIFDSGIGMDFLLMHEAKLLKDRLLKNDDKPIISSACPSWVKYAESFYPELLPLLSPYRSHQQWAGKLIKDYAKKNLVADCQGTDVFQVAVMPCTSRKYEASREEMFSNGKPDVDLVLTTREFIQLLTICNIDLAQLEAEPANSSLAISSSSAKLMGVPGGIAQGIVRTLHFLIEGKDMDELNVVQTRKIKDVGFFEVEIGKQKVNFAVVSGNANGLELFEKLSKNETNLHYVEVMTCPGGCVAGGGQLRFDEDQLKKRQKALYALDDNAMLRVPYKNPALKTIQKENDNDSDHYKTGYKKREDILK